MLSVPIASSIPSEEAYLKQCIAGCERLLFIAVEEAVKTSREKNSTTSRDYELLINCLEETENYVVQEVILRVLNSSKTSYPETLLASLTSMRFAETTSLKLLVDSKAPLHIHKLTFTVCIWSLRENFQVLPEQIMKYRLANSKILTESEISSTKQTAAEQQHLEIIRFSSIIKPAVKALTTLTMLAESIRISCKENSCHSLNGNSNAFNLSSPIMDFLTDNNQFTSGTEICSGNEYDPKYLWLLLPLFPCALVLSDALSVQRLLMSLCISLKTDELQSEMLSAIYDEVWLETFVDMAVISCNLDDGTVENATISSNCVELTIDALGQK